MSGVALARAAKALVGIPFRLHGRDPATGLDCVGLYTAAMDAIGRRVAIPPAYGLRNSDLARPLGFVAQAGLIDATGPILAGDVLLLRLGPVQAHMVIALGADGFVHAHAGLRRVAISPGPIPHAILRHWRIADLDQED